MIYTTEIDYKGDEQITGVDEDSDTEENLYFPDDCFPSDDAEHFFKEDL